MASYYTLGSRLGDLMRNIAQGSAIKQAVYNAQMHSNYLNALLGGNNRLSKT